MALKIPLLNRKFLSTYQPNIDIKLPDINKFDLPEKVIQFGEGVFIRAFFNYFLEIANSNSIFNGRAVVIQPVHVEKAKILNDQDCLFTLCSRGLRNGRKQEDYFIISSISKAYTAKLDWNDILKCSRSPEIEIITSNTTEAGITYDSDDKLDFNPPISFPGKLTTFLYHRYENFDAAPDAGLLILPLELVENNGDTLKKIIKKLIKNWNLENKFLNWFEKANIFCNTLVDRIVTGYPIDEIDQFRKILEYEDKMLNTAELYHIWIIEGGKKVQRIIPLDNAGLNVLFVPDLTPYYLRKVRILNGAHTSMVHMSYLIGNNLVKESIEHPLVSKFIKNFLFKEVIPSMNMPEKELIDYANVIMERFRNPFIKHLLINITLNSNSKFRYRILPTLIEYYEKYKKIPKLIPLSFASFLYFMKISKGLENKFYGMRNKELYEIKDDKEVIQYYNSEWEKVDLKKSETIERFVTNICKNKDYWQVDLTTLGNFKDLVVENLLYILKNNINFALKKILESN
ncbi:MAG: tagaturonate reductase [Candidatus Hodarchaeota archaeon]